MSEGVVSVVGCCFGLREERGGGCVPKVHIWLMLWLLWLLTSPSPLI